MLMVAESRPSAEALQAASIHMCQRPAFSYSFLGRFQLMKGH